MTIAVLTPSYAPDLGAFRQLHETVLEHTGDEVLHHVIVPDGDVPLFAAIGSPRLHVHGYRSILPHSFVSTAWFARAVAAVPGLPRGARFIAVNLRRPWPPQRGWMLQQIVKLSAARALDADTLVMVDSDMQLVGPVNEATFRSPDGAVRFYTAPGGITEGMTRHVGWHDTARRLLGLPVDGPPPYDDPIAGLLAWDPRLVRDCTDRVATITGRRWEDALSGLWDFSEYVLYGEYLRELAPAPARSFVSERTLCHNWWGPHPLRPEDVDDFVAAAAADDLAFRVQSTTGTDSRILRRVRQEMTARRARE